MYRLQKKYRRVLSLLMAGFLFFSVPIRAYATSAAVPISYSVGSYILNLILNACGIDFSLSSVASVLGQWAGYDDYMERGSKGQLGAFSQYLYDCSQNAATAEAREEFNNLIHVLDDAVHASWGAVVSGVKPLIEAVKEWLSGLAGYGTETLIYTTSASDAIKDSGWTRDSYCTTVKFPLVYYSGSYIDTSINNSGRYYWFTSYGACSYGDASYVRNWYKKINSEEVFGLYHPDTDVVEFYRKDGNGGYEAVTCFYHYGFILADGSYKFSAGNFDYGQIGYVFCERKYLGNLPFTVFLDEPSMAEYCQTGTVNNIAKAGQIGLEALSVNVGVQKSALAAVPDVITLPENAEAALKNVGVISGATADEAALKSALGSAGLVIDWRDEITDIPDTPGITDTDIKELMEKVAAIPAQITDLIFGQFDKKGEDVMEQMSIPSMIIQKFPFCIPFDVIYFIRILLAERETPRFEIPLTFDYLDFHYHEVFVLDFSAYDQLVTVLRVMLDLLFCACLINGTRALIRG